MGVDMQGKTALHYIVSVDDNIRSRWRFPRFSVERVPAWLDLTKQLLDAKADVNARDSKVCEHLHLVAYDNNLACSIPRIMLSHFAQCASDVQGMTPLHYAALHDNDKFAEVLLKSGADVSAECQMVSHIMLACLLARSLDSTPRLLLCIMTQVLWYHYTHLHSAALLVELVLSELWRSLLRKQCCITDACPGYVSEAVESLANGESTFWGCVICACLRERCWCCRAQQHSTWLHRWTPLRQCSC